MTEWGAIELERYALPFRNGLLYVLCADIPARHPRYREILMRSFAYAPLKMNASMSSSASLNGGRAYYLLGVCV